MEKPEEDRIVPGTDGSGAVLPGLLAAAVEASTDAVVIAKADTNKTVVWANSAIETLTGYTRQEVIGQSMAALWSGGQPADIYDGVWAAVLSGRKWQGEVVNRRKDGSSYEESRTVIPVLDAQGQVSHVIAIQQEIGERNRLREEVHRLAHVIENSPNSVGTTDVEGNFVSLNSAFLRIVGYAKEELLGKHFNTVMANSNPQALLREIAASRFEPAGWAGEIVYRRRDGSNVLVALTVRPCTDTQGRVTGSFGISHDISERKRAEEALRQSHAMFEALFESSPDALLAVDEDGRIVRLNSQVEKLFGYSRDELLGSPVEMLIPERFRPGHETHLSEYNNRPRIREMGGGLELYGRRKDGSEFPAEIVLSPLQTETGKLALSVVRDITERKKTEAALEQSESKFKTLFETAGDAILIMNEGKFVDCNLQSQTLFQCGREGIVGHSPLEFSPTAQPDGRLSSETAEAYMRAALTGLPQLFEWKLVRHDGTSFDGEIRLNRLIASETMYLQATLRDVTERKQADRTLKETHERLNAALQNSERQSREAAKLNELVDVLQSCQSLEEAYTIAANTLQTALACPSGALYMMRASRNILESVAIWGSVLVAENSFRPEECWAMRRSRVHQVKDPGSAMRCPHLLETPPGGYFCVPLASQGETIGVLYLESVVQPAPATPESGQRDRRADRVDIELRQATAVGERLSLALGNLRLREALRAQSIRDPLTNLFNRRYMEESLEREISRAVRSGVPVALLMLDIDHFKQFNDTFGHQVGDALLRALGDFLIERTRGQDVACRYGGEEFALILTGASRESAQQRAEILRSDLTRLTVDHAGQSVGKVTLSIGIAVAPEHGTGGTELLRVADASLYRAKAEGRDRVVAAV